MNYQAQYKLSNYVYTIRTKIYKYSIIKKFIQLVHGLWTLLLITNAATQISCKQNPLCRLMLNFVQQNILTFSIVKTAYFGLIFTHLLLFFSGIFYVRICPRIFESYQQSMAQKIICLVSSGSFLLSQILICPALYYICQQAYLTSLLNAFLLGSLVYAGYYLINCTISRYSIYDGLILVIVPILSLKNYLFAHLLVVLLISYKMYKSKSKLARFIYVFVGATILSNIWGRYVGQPLRLNPFKTAFYLGLEILLASVFVLFFQHKFRYLSNEEFFKDIISKTEKIQQNQEIRSHFKTAEILSIFKFIGQKSARCGRELHQKMHQAMTFSLSVKELHSQCYQLLQQQFLICKSLINQIMLTRFKIILGKSLAEILLFLHSNDIDIAKMSWQQKVEYIELLQKLKSNYCSFSQSGKLEISEIQQIDEKMVELRQKIYNIALNQIQFWQVLAQKNINLSLLYEKYDKITKFRQQISAIKLNDVNNFNKWQVLYDQIQTKWNQYDNSFDQNQTPLNGDIVKSRGFDNYANIGQPNRYNKILSSSQMEQEQLQSCKFILISNSKIEKISTSLADQLKICRQNYKDVDLRWLFDEQVSQLLNNKLKKVTLQSQSQYFPLPILNYQHVFVSAKARVLWYPNIDGKLKYMIQLFTFTEYPALLYNISKNAVCSYNEKFVQNFQISDKKIGFLLEKQQVDFQRLFNSSFQGNFSQNVNPNNNQTRQLQNLFVSLQINLRGLQQEFSDKTSLLHKVAIRVQQRIYFENTKLAVLQLKTQKYAKKDTLTSDSSTNYNEEAEKNESAKNIGDMRKIEGVGKNHNVRKNEGAENKDYMRNSPASLVQINKFQTFFCRIPNSYQSKISQKVALINHTKRFRNFFYLIIVSTVIISLSVSWNLLNFIHFKQRSDYYIVTQNSMKNSSEQYIFLYKMYNKAFKNYHASNYPEDILRNRNLNATKILDVTNYDIQYFLTRFIQKFLNNYHSQPNADISYKLSFDQFNVTTSTSQSTLMDFAENFKKTIELNEYDFILKNYLSFRDLTIKFQSSQNYQTKIQDQHEKTFVFQVCLQSAVFAMVILLLLASLKNERNVQAIIQMFSKIERQIVLSRILYLNQMVKANFQILQKELTTRQKPQQQLLQEEETSRDLIHPQSLRQQSNTLKNDAKTVIFIPEQHANTLIPPSSTTKLHHELHQFEKKQKTYEISSKYSQKIIKYILYILLFTFFLLESAFNFTDMRQQKENIFQFLNYQKLIFNRAFGMNRVCTDALVTPIYKHKYNKTIQLSSDVNLTLYSRFQQTSQIQQILQVQQIVKRSLQTDLCRYQMRSTSIQMIPCEKYVDGILTRGYSQTYTYWLSLSQVIKKLNLSQFQAVKCTLINCPPYYVFDYVYQRLNNALQKAQFAFQQKRGRTVEKILTAQEQNLIWKLLLNIPLSVLLCILVWHEAKVSNRTIELFKIFPKESLNKMKLTSQMRKKNVLQQLSYI